MTSKIVFGAEGRSYEELNVQRPKESNTPERLEVTSETGGDRLMEAWQTISVDEQLRGVLAILLGHTDDFSEAHGRMLVTDLYRLRDKYKTRASLEATLQTHPILDYISNPGKKVQYAHKLQIFMDLVYG